MGFILRAVVLFFYSAANAGDIRKMDLASISSRPGVGIFIAASRLKKAKAEDISTIMNFLEEHRVTLNTPVDFKIQGKEIVVNGHTLNVDHKKKVYSVDRHQFISYKGKPLKQILDDLYAEMNKEQGSKSTSYPSIFPKAHAEDLRLTKKVMATSAAAAVMGTVISVVADSPSVFSLTAVPALTFLGSVLVFIFKATAADAQELPHVQTATCDANGLNITMANQDKIQYSIRGGKVVTKVESLGSVAEVDAPASKQKDMLLVLEECKKTPANPNELVKSLNDAMVAQMMAGNTEPAEKSSVQK